MLNSAAGRNVADLKIGAAHEDNLFHTLHNIGRFLTKTHGDVGQRADGDKV